MSRSAGHVDWKGLLRNIAKELGLDLRLENDLITMAQFYVNNNVGHDALAKEILEQFPSSGCSWGSLVGFSHRHWVAVTSRPAHLKAPDLASINRPHWPLGLASPCLPRPAVGECRARRILVYVG
jgi:hypothetical protein